MWSEEVVINAPRTWLVTPDELDVTIEIAPFSMDIAESLRGNMESGPFDARTSPDRISLQRTNRCSKPLRRR